MSILNGTLTREQQHTLELILKAGMVDVEEEIIVDEGPNELAEYVTRMRGDGAPDPEIARSIKGVAFPDASYPEIAGVLGTDVGTVIKWMSGGE